MSYKLFGANVSPFVRKVRAYMAEKGLAYEHEPVNPFQPPPNFRSISPLGKIPALLDGDRPLPDSTAICLYLERRHPERPLYPVDDYLYARALWVEEYVDSGLTPVAGPQVFRPLVLDPIVQKKVLTREVKDAALEVVENQIAPMWDYLERELGGKPFFVGDALSVADLAVTSAHVNLRYAGVVPDATHWPRLAAFLARMLERPSFAALLAEEAPTWDRREAVAAV